LQTIVAVGRTTSARSIQAVAPLGETNCAGGVAGAAIAGDDADAESDAEGDDSPCSDANYLLTVAMSDSGEVKHFAAWGGAGATIFDGTRGRGVAITPNGDWVVVGESSGAALATSPAAADAVNRGLDDGFILVINSNDADGSAVRSVAPMNAADHGEVTFVVAGQGLNTARDCSLRGGKRVLACLIFICLLCSLPLSTVSVHALIALFFFIFLQKTAKELSCAAAQRGSRQRTGALRAVSYP
jgi:hypothetical protein